MTRLYLENPGPWTLPEAREAVHDAAAAQAKAEDRVKDAYRAFAEAEAAYRRQLAIRILEYKAEGIAITMCGELARGDERVSELRRSRDIAEGAREAAVASLWRMNANRKDVRAFATWSQRREFAENFDSESPNAFDD